MKQLFILFILFSYSPKTFGQKDAQFFYDKGCHTQKIAQSTPNGKRLHRKSIRLFNKALKINSAFPEAHFSKGVSYHELGQDSVAIICFNKAIELKPDYAIAFQHRGVTKAEKRIQNYTGAIQDFDTVIKLNAGNAYTYYFRGYSKYKLGMLREACEDRKTAETLGGVGYDWLQYCKE